MAQYRTGQVTVIQNSNIAIGIGTAWLNTVTSVTQTTHGFVVGDVLKVTGGVYSKAQANNTTNAAAVGIVYSVTDANNFVLCTSGYVGGLSGLTVGITYYLSDTVAGALTATAPTAPSVIVPLVTATSITEGYYKTPQPVKAGHSFKILGEDASYTINSVDSNTQIQLSLAYAGISKTASYLIARDFTPHKNLPEVSEGDADWAYGLTQALRKLDSEPLVNSAVGKISEASNLPLWNNGPWPGSNGGAFANITGNPTDNTALATALNGKAGKDLATSTADGLMSKEDKSTIQSQHFAGLSVGDIQTNGKQILHAVGSIDAVNPPYQIGSTVTNFATAGLYNESSAGNIYHFITQARNTGTTNVVPLLSFAFASGMNSSAWGINTGVYAEDTSTNATVIGYELNYGILENAVNATAYGLVVNPTGYKAVSSGVQLQAASSWCAMNDGIVFNTGGTIAGAQNLVTVGNNTTVTTTANAFSVVRVGDTITANGSTRVVTAKASNISLTVNIAVDWDNGGIGYSFVKETQPVTNALLSVHATAMRPTYGIDFSALTPASGYLLRGTGDMGLTTTNLRVPNLGGISAKRADDGTWHQIFYFDNNNDVILNRQSLLGLPARKPANVIVGVGESKGFYISDHLLNHLLAIDEYTGNSTFSGNVTAATFYGSAAGLTDLPLATLPIVTISANTTLSVNTSYIVTGGTAYILPAATFDATNPPRINISVPQQIGGGGPSITIQGQSTAPSQDLYIDGQRLQGFYNQTYTIGAGESVMLTYKSSGFWTCDAKDKYVNPTGSSQWTTVTGGINYSGGFVGIGQATVANALDILSSADSGANSTILVKNTNNTGVSASSSIKAIADTANAQLFAHGSGRTATRYGITLGGYGELLSGAGNGLLIGTGTNAKDIIFGTNGAERARITSAGNLRLSNQPAAPASATATGTTGDLIISGGYIYFCSATNTWVRAALSTW